MDFPIPSSPGVSRSEFLKRYLHKSEPSMPTSPANRYIWKCVKCGAFVSFDASNICPRCGPTEWEAWERVITYLSAMRGSPHDFKMEWRPQSKDPLLAGSSWHVPTTKPRPRPVGARVDGTIVWEDEA